MTTIDYYQLPANIVDKFLDNETVQYRSESDASLATSPSPFYVPVAIRAILTDRNSCKLTFVYPNDERPEHAFRQVPTIRGMRVHVGQYSGKIVELEFDDAIHRLTEGLRIEPTSLMSVAPRAMSNALLIASLLASMPSEYRDMLLAGLRKLNSGKI